MAYNLPNNILTQVQTYQMAELAFLDNSFCGIHLTNKKFQNFNEKTANLGDTVTFDIAPRFVSTPGLVITQQPSVQRIQTLTVGNAHNVARAYTDQQFIFNVEEYMGRFGKSGILELGTAVEKDIMKAVDSTQVYEDKQSALYGQYVPNSGPYRFYGDGVTQINNYGQLAQALANFRTYGAAKDKMIGILPERIEPSIVSTGLNQFAMTRNNDIANSWEIGTFSGCQWYRSNLLPIHISGTIGNATGGNNYITITGTNDPTGQNITQFTFTEPTGATSSNAINVGDLLQANLPTLNFLTFIGHVLTTLPVQIVATAVSSTSAGVGTLTFRTSTNLGLCSAFGQNQNINQQIVPGMTFTVMPSHQCGLIASGDEWYLAMPRLPSYEPYSYSYMTDEESGVSIRSYWGNLFGQNNRSYVTDIIWGSTMVPENCMRLLFPLTQGT